SRGRSSDSPGSHWPGLSGPTVHSVICPDMSAWAPSNGSRISCSLWRPQTPDSTGKGASGPLAAGQSRPSRRRVPETSDSRVARACAWSGFLQGDQDRGKGGDNPSGRGEPLAFPVSSRMNADDHLPRASFGRVEGGDGIVEGGDGADVRAQPSVPHSLNDLAQLGAIGFDDEVDRQAVGGPCLDRSDDGHERSSGSNQARGPLPDVAADEIEHEIDSADVFQDLVVEVDELVRAEVERLLTIGGASGADDVGARQSCELRHHRPDCAGRAVRDDALPCPKAAVLEQSLPRSQARDRQARAHREVDV